MSNFKSTSFTMLNREADDLKLRLNNCPTTYGNNEAWTAQQQFQVQIQRQNSLTLIPHLMSGINNTAIKL